MLQSLVVDNRCGFWGFRSYAKQNVRLSVGQTGVPDPVKPDVSGEKRFPKRETSWCTLSFTHEMSSHTLFRCLSIVRPRSELSLHWQRAAPAQYSRGVAYSKSDPLKAQQESQNLLHGWSHPSTRVMGHLSSWAEYNLFSIQAVHYQSALREMKQTYVFSPRDSVEQYDIQGSF